MLHYNKLINYFNLLFPCDTHVFSGLAIATRQELNEK